MSLVVCAFATSRAHAQASAASDVEGEVRVRGQSDAAGYVTRAREQDSPRDVTDAASLAETLPGVHVRRLGADDGFATLSIRGSGSSQVSVLLAGVPLTGGSDPTLDLGSLPVWPGVQMRAYRTFAPASLGPGSLGGTLTLDPPPMSTEPSSETYLAYGSLGSARMRASDSRPLGQGEVVTAISASRSDDEFTFFLPDARGGSFVRRQNAGHAQASALVSVVEPASFAEGRKGSVRITVIGQARRQELPGTTIDPTPFDRLDTLRLIPALELSGETDQGAWRVRAYGRRDEETLTTGLGSFASSHQGDGFIVAGVGTGWRGRLGERTRLDVSIDGSGERYAPGAVASGTTPEGSRRLASGAGADVDVAITRALTGSVSGRVDAWRDQGTGSVGAAHSELRPTGHAGIEIREGLLSVATHAGTTARPPAFVELFGNRGAFLPNPNLKTESATTVDLGARLRPRWGRLRVDGGVTGFATFAEDLITFVPVGAFGRAKADNIGRARILGVEGEVTATWAPFELRAVYTFLDTSNQGDGACSATLGSCERPPLPGRPKNDLIADAVVHLGPARLRYGIDWVSGIAADLQGTVNVPGRVLQSAGARVDFKDVLERDDRVTVSVEVKNLADLRIVDYPGVSGPAVLPVGDAWAYPLPGRTALASLRWHL